MKSISRILAATIVAFSFVYPNIANSKIIHVGVAWSGSGIGGTAIASGFIILDDSLFTGPTFL